MWEKHQFFCFGFSCYLFFCVQTEKALTRLIRKAGSSEPLYDAALLVRYCTQRALCPYFDSKINQFKHLNNACNKLYAK